MITFKQFLEEEFLDEMPFKNSYTDNAGSVDYVFFGNTHKKIGEYTTSSGKKLTVKAGTGEYSTIHKNFPIFNGRKPVARISLQSRAEFPSKGMYVSGSFSGGGNEIHQAFHHIMRHLERNGHAPEVFSNDQSEGAAKYWEKMHRSGEFDVKLKHPVTGEEKPVEDDWKKNYEGKNQTWYMIARSKK